MSQHGIPLCFCGHYMYEHTTYFAGAGYWTSRCSNCACAHGRESCKVVATTEFNLNEKI